MGENLHSFYTPDWGDVESLPSANVCRKSLPDSYLRNLQRFPRWLQPIVAATTLAGASITGAEARPAGDRLLG